MDCRKLLELEHSKKIVNEDEEVIWGWKGIAGTIRAKRRAGLFYNFITAALNSINNDGIKILELGCGTGLFTQILFSHFDCNIASMDIYEGFVHKALDKAKKTKNNVMFLIGDAELLPFLNDSFDIIAGVSILHHLNLNSALKGIYRVLKPGGKFIFSEPNMLNPQIFIQKNIKFIKKYANEAPLETAFYPSRLQDAFVKHNLKVKIYPFDFLHPKTPGSLVPIVERVGLWLEKQPFLKNIAGSLLIQGEKI